MAQVTPTHHFKPDRHIFKEGDRPDGLYLICKGKVRITKKTSDDIITLAELGEGAIFGEMAMIDNKPRSASAVSVTDVWAYMVTTNDFEKKLGALDPFMKGVFRVLVNTIRESNRRQALFF